MLLLYIRSLKFIELIFITFVSCRKQTVLLFEIKFFSYFSDGTHFGAVYWSAKFSRIAELSVALGKILIAFELALDNFCLEDINYGIIRKITDYMAM